MPTASSSAAHSCGWWSRSEDRAGAVTAVRTLIRDLASGLRGQRQAGARPVSLPPPSAISRLRAARHVERRGSPCEVYRATSVALRSGPLRPGTKAVEPRASLVEASVGSRRRDVVVVVVTASRRFLVWPSTMPVNSMPSPAPGDHANGGAEQDVLGVVFDGCRDAAADCAEQRTEQCPCRRFRRDEAAAGAPALSAKPSESPTPAPTSAPIPVPRPTARQSLFFQPSCPPAM